MVTTLDKLSEVMHRFIRKHRLFRKPMGRYIKSIGSGDPKFKADDPSTWRSTSNEPQEWFLDVLLARPLPKSRQLPAAFEGVTVRTRLERARK
jgi:hypothetical protein